MNPIFIHCLPRVGSTWFGSKFAAQLGNGYFYEPMHEIMIDGTHQRARDEFARLRAGKSLRHPVGIKPYFHNYSFASGGGVPGFLKRFCYENYALAPDKKDPEFKAYWSTLLKFAFQQCGSELCFKDTQSSLRQGWMKRNFGGVHIYLVQHPRLTDKSYHSFRGFNNRYIREFALIVGKNRDHPAFKEMSAWSGITPPAEGRSIAEEIKHYSALFTAPLQKRDPRYSRQYHYSTFCLFWTLGLAHASRYADIIVDMEALHNEADRKLIEASLHKKTGLAIDLSDYKPKIPKKTVGEENFVMTDEVLGIIKRALPHVDPNWDRTRQFPLSPGTQQAVNFFGSGKIPDRLKQNKLFTALPLT